jgi:hypothetical protein
MADWVGSPRFPATGSSSGVPSRGSTSCWSDAFPCLCTWADVLHCSGLRSGATDLLCPLLTPVRRSGSVSRSSASFTRTRVPKAPDRPPGVRHVTVAARAPDLQNASQPQREGFAVTCPLAPDASRLLSDFCSSPRSFGFGHRKTPPRDDALAVSLAFGSANTWLPDFHRHRYVPCPAHTSAVSRVPLAARRPRGVVGWQGTAVIGRRASTRCALRYGQAFANRFLRCRGTQRLHRANRVGRESCVNRIGA